MEGVAGQSQAITRRTVLDNEQIVLIVDLESFGAELARQRETQGTAITATSANIYG
jgi:hypothetical protein